MPERTAAEVLAEKLWEEWKLVTGRMEEIVDIRVGLQQVAARLAEDPAIMVRTDMAEECFLVKFQFVPHARALPVHTPEGLWDAITTPHCHYVDNEHQRIIVRPYPEEGQ